MPLTLTRRGFMAAATGGLAALVLQGCSSAGDGKVVIYSCGEGEANEVLLKAMHRDLPQYDIRLHYVSTGTCAAKLQNEGTSSEADIVLMLEGGYLRQIQPSLAVLEGYDFNVFEGDLLDGSSTYLPFRRESACVAMNTAGLEARGIPVPESYDELLNPVYKGFISMANPKSSGTGYNFVKSLVKTRGEGAAFEYFDELAKNVYQFSSSGSGPVNALVQGEALIGFGLTYQAVSEINKGVPIEVRFFEEGSPWTMNGVAVVDGKQAKPAVRGVMDWMYSTGILLDKQRFVPDKVFVEQDTEIANYPKDARYANMDGVFDIDEKKRLLGKWKF
ncbi:ABC transporter substrate-binding protein [Gordonibacter urolithinfaciens]|nr:ABC transporter substrate-binding protein [Gordonibacter urolithinfaciens]